MQEQATNPQNPYLIPGAIVIAGIFMSGAIFYTRGDTAPNVPTDPTPSAPVDISIDLEGWPVKGDPDAPVTIVEYSDFACPYCARFWGDTLPMITQNYIDEGLVRFVYKDFAVVGGERAAEAAHCAAEQDAYWEYHDMLFSHNAEDRATWADVNVHRGYADQLGLDADELAECFESRRHQAKVASGAQEAMSNGGQGTPFFLVNETPISGAQPYAAFQTVIDLELEE